MGDDDGARRDQRGEGRDQQGGMALDRQRGEPVANGDGECAGGGVGQQPCVIRCGEAAAEIGAQQILAAIRAGAADNGAGEAASGEIGGEGWRIEFGVYRVACCGVGGLEGEMGHRGQAVAGAAEGDPRRGEAAKILPQAGRGSHQSSPIKAGDMAVGICWGVARPSRPIRASHASNSGAGRRPSAPRR